MASGWAPDGAVQGQIDDTVTDEVMRARARKPTGRERPTVSNAAAKSRTRAGVYFLEFKPALHVNRSVIAGPPPFPVELQGIHARHFGRDPRQTAPG